MEYIKDYKEYVLSIDLEEYNDDTDHFEHNQFNVGDKVVVREDDTTNGKEMTIASIFYDHGYCKILTIDEEMIAEYYDNDVAEGNYFINLKVVK